VLEAAKVRVQLRVAPHTWEAFRLAALDGVPALQADLLDNDRFAEACSAWATRKDTPLADLLVPRAEGDR
jgi:hypothetical protein